MFQRTLADTLSTTVNSFPVTVLTGPRQSGKTTLLQTLFPNFTYVSLEIPDHLLRIKDDPRGFLQLHENGLIVDEAQHYPELFSYIQEAVDQTHKPNKLILSGSQNFLLAENISQTLAGRAAILELLPLTYQEFLSVPKKPQPTLWEFLFQGGYPRPYYENLAIDIWYNSYIRTYIERDVRSIINIKDLAQFQLFLKLCAGQHGQEFNASNIAQACGVSQTTIMTWLNILEASYIVFRLQPYYQNFKKRLVKRSKLYFYDTAIVCRLLGIESPQHLAMHASRSALFEGFVISEIIKNYYAKGKHPAIYFWREHSGHEVDIILEKADTLISIEIKSGMTITKNAFAGSQHLQKIVGKEKLNSFLIYAGDENFKLKGIDIISWKNISDCTQFF